MTRALGYGAMGAYSSSTCHYCGKRATTDDHIVPRAAFLVHQSALPYWFRQHNIAPCCQPCNSFKADFRSDCTCDQCVWVWLTVKGMATKWIKPKYHRLVLLDPKCIRRVIAVGQSRG